MQSLLVLLRGKKTYLVAAAAILYLALCQFLGKEPSSEIMFIFGSLGLVTLRAGLSGAVTMHPIPGPTPKAPGGTVLPLLLLLLLPALLLTPGCIAYRHDRESGTQVMGVTKEGTWFVSFFSGSRASAIRSHTQDTNGYVRTLTVGAFATKPDANTITNSVAAGVKAAVPAP